MGVLEGVYGNVFPYCILQWKKKRYKGYFPKVN